MKVTKSLFPPDDKNLSTIDRVRAEASFARRRLDFYGLVTQTYRGVASFLTGLSVVLPLAAIIIFFMKFTYHNHVAAVVMLGHVLVILTKMNAEKKYATFFTASHRATTQWQRWDAILEDVHCGQSPDAAELTRLRQIDKAIYGNVVQYGIVEQHDDDQ